MSEHLQAGQETHQQAPGKVLTVEFRLSGQPFVALNGGPSSFAFTEAVSFQIGCRDQAEVDHYWARLLEGGGVPGHCGWLKDRFGLSWQVVPVQLPEMLGGADVEGAKRATVAMMGMAKLDVAALTEAFGSSSSS